MYRQAIAVSVGLCLSAPYARPQGSSSALSPDQLVEAAIARNRDFLSLKQRLNEAQGAVKQAGVGIADNLEFNAIAGQPVGNAGEDNFNISYAHTFETFGKRNKRIAIALKELALAHAELDERRRALSFEVKMRYVENHKPILQCTGNKALHGYSSSPICPLRATDFRWNEPTLTTSSPSRRTDRISVSFSRVFPVLIALSSNAIGDLRTNTTVLPFT